MKKIAVTQRVVLDERGKERRDALDQLWIPLLQEACLFPVLVPNNFGDIRKFLELASVQGLLLTGGNDLAHIGGPDAAPERDKTEKEVLQFSIEKKLPVLGVCRGMQFLVHFFGGKIRRVDGHAGSEHFIEHHADFPIHVKSYHRWGSFERDLPPVLQLLATAPDKVIEAISHRELPILGVQWHPERDSDRQSGVRLLKKAFGF